MTEANNNLKAEEILGYDAEYHFASESVEGSLTGYVNRIHNQIVNQTILPAESSAICGFLPDNAVCRQRNNLDTGWIGGTELDGTYKLNHQFSITASYLLSESNITNPGQTNELKGKQNAQLLLIRHCYGLRIIRIYTEHFFSCAMLVLN